MNSSGAYGQSYGSNFGGGPPPGYTPPSQGGGGPPGYGGGPPRSYGWAMGSGGPPPGVSPELWQWFLAVDADRNGKITADELQKALMNGNWSPFNGETCRLMVGMFDKDRNGTIDVHEFSALWKYIQDWKSCFDRFDTDKSGNIDANELSNAFRTFGYNLSMGFSQMCVRVFDRGNRNSFEFDDFIQCCVMLKALTDKFKEKDKDEKGIINVYYEEFLRMVLDNTLIL